MQDFLRLGTDSRMNIPSTIGGGNWAWRIDKNALTNDLARKIKCYPKTYFRLPEYAKDKSNESSDYTITLKNNDTIVETDVQKLLEKTALAIEKNNMKCYIAQTKEDVIPIVKELIKSGDTIALGGSMTLKETGVMELLTNGDYNYIDRSKFSSDEIKKCFRDAFSADVYFSSSNAITQNGDLYNVDGNSNRVAAITFGPDSVVIVAGYNKIVPDLNAAVARVKEVCAPANVERLDLNTPCRSLGKCIKSNGVNQDLSDGCNSKNRICCSYVINSQQRIKDRIKVILVGESLGY